MRLRTRNKSRIIFSSFLIFFTVDLFHVIYSYYSLRYTSDGFHYFTFLRNFSQGIPYEGPTFGYLFAFHSYVTLILLIPLAYFSTPLFLALLSNSAWWLSLILLIQIGKMKFDGQWKFLFALFFLFNPIFVRTRFGTSYMFQPDFLGPPLFLMYMYFLLRFRLRISLLFLCLGMLTKEEFPLWYGLLALLFLQMEVKDRIKKYKLQKQIVGIAIGSSAIHLVNLTFFSQIQKDNLPSIFSRHFAMHNTLFLLILFLAIIAVIYFVTCTKDSNRHTFFSHFWFLQFCGLCIIAFFFCSNLFIYGHVSGQTWRNYAILIPSIAILLLHFIDNKFLFQGRYFSFHNSEKKVIEFLVLFMIILGSMLWELQRNNELQIRDYFQIRNLVSTIPRELSDDAYFVVEPFFHAAVLDVRSANLVELPFNGSKSHLIGNASYLLTQEMRLNASSSNQLRDFFVFSRSTDFVLLTRKD